MSSDVRHWKSMEILEKSHAMMWACCGLRYFGRDAGGDISDTCYYPDILAPVILKAVDSHLSVCQILCISWLYSELLQLSVSTKLI